jgi:hypothetical protein
MLLAKPGCKPSPRAMASEITSACAPKSIPSSRASCRWTSGSSTERTCRYHHFRRHLSRRRQCRHRHFHRPRRLRPRHLGFAELASSRIQLIGDWLIPDDGSEKGFVNSEFLPVGDRRRKQLDGTRCQEINGDRRVGGLGRAPACGERPEEAEDWFDRHRAGTRVPRSISPG